MPKSEPKAEEFSNETLEQVMASFPAELLDDEQDPEDDGGTEDPGKRKNPGENRDDDPEPDDETGSDNGEEDESEEDDAPAAQAIEIDGEKLTLDELKQGFMRTKDYTVKTQKLAQQRRDFEQQASEFGALLQAGKQQHLQELQRYQGVPWAQLQVEDPARYDQLRQQFQTVATAAQQAETREQQFVQQYRRMRSTIAERQALEAREELDRTLPGGWTEELYGALRNHAVSQGLDSTVFDTINNAALMRMIWQSQQYEQGARRLQKGAGADGAQPRVRRPAPVGRTGTPGKASVARQKQHKLYQKARKSGSLDDMAVFLESTLPSSITDD